MKEEGKPLKAQGLFTNEQIVELRKDLKKYNDNKNKFHLKKRIEQQEKIAEKFGKTWLQIKQWIQFDRMKQNPDWLKMRNEKNNKRYTTSIKRYEKIEEKRRRAEESKEVTPSESQKAMKVKRGSEKNSSQKKDKSFAESSIVSSETDEVCDFVDVKNGHSPSMSRKRRRSKLIENNEKQSSSNQLKKDQNRAKKSRRDDSSDDDEEEDVDSSDGQSSSLSSSDRSSADFLSDGELAEYYEDDEVEELHETIYDEGNDYEPVGDRELTEEEAGVNYVAPEEDEGVDKEKENDDTEEEASVETRVYTLEELTELDLKERKLLPKDMSKDFSKWKSKEVRKWAELFLDARGMKLFNTLKINGSDLLQFKSNDLDFYTKLKDDCHEINIYFYNQICHSIKQLIDSEKTYLRAHKPMLQKLGIVPMDS
uniref:SAM domain-containing protein n=1 Tax=Caenorhabditis tropicalis TaxID=1561998 RepID=A0A1I7UCH2_9PELO